MNIRDYLSLFVITISTWGMTNYIIDTLHIKNIPVAILLLLLIFVFFALTEIDKIEKQESKKYCNDKFWMRSYFAFTIIFFGVGLYYVPVFNKLGIFNFIIASGVFLWGYALSVSYQDEDQPIEHTPIIQKPKPKKIKLQEAFNMAESMLRNKGIEPTRERIRNILKTHDFFSNYDYSFTNGDYGELKNNTFVYKRTDG